MVGNSLAVSWTFLAIYNTPGLWEYHKWPLVTPKGGELTKVAKEQTIDQNNHADNFILSPLIWIRYQWWDGCWTWLQLVRWLDFPEKTKQPINVFLLSNKAPLKIFHPADCILFGYLLNYCVFPLFFMCSSTTNNCIISPSFWQVIGPKKQLGCKHELWLFTLYCFFFLSEVLHDLIVLVMVG